MDQVRLSDQVLRANDQVSPASCPYIDDVFRGRQRSKLACRQSAARMQLTPSQGSSSTKFCIRMTKFLWQVAHL